MKENFGLKIEYKSLSPKHYNKNTYSKDNEDKLENTKEYKSE